MQTSIEQSMRANGLRMTRARRRILDILKRADRPVSVADIERLFSSGVPDRVTVYRQLRTLEGVGIVSRADTPGRAERYELGREHHHHFVCGGCGNSVCLDGHLSERFVDAASKSLREQGLFVQGHSIVFSGECKVCHNK